MGQEFPHSHAAGGKSVAVQRADRGGDVDGAPLGARRRFLLGEGIGHDEDPGSQRIRSGKGNNGNAEDNRLDTEDESESLASMKGMAVQGPFPGTT